MDKRSEKRKAKLRVKNKNFRYFWNEASLRIFSFASLSQFKRNLSRQLNGHLTRKLRSALKVREKARVSNLTGKNVNAAGKGEIK